jgi:antitoxin component of MazEF toxin-antitoxin module
MIKTLQKHGNSHALVIDKALMEALGIDENTPLQLTLNGTTLVVAPVEVGLGEKDIAEAIAELRPKYAGMLKRLAE